MRCEMCRDRPAVYMVHTRINDASYGLTDFRVAMCDPCYYAFMAGRCSEGKLECEGL